jgi:hypothetical protein
MLPVDKVTKKPPIKRARKLPTDINSVVTTTNAAASNKVIDLASIDDATSVSAPVVMVRPALPKPVPIPPVRQPNDIIMFERIIVFTEKTFMTLSDGRNVYAFKYPKSNTRVYTRMMSDGFIRERIPLPGIFSGEDFEMLLENIIHHLKGLKMKGSMFTHYTYLRKDNVDGRSLALQGEYDSSCGRYYGLGHTPTVYELSLKKRPDNDNQLLIGLLSSERELPEPVDSVPKNDKADSFFSSGDPVSPTGTASGSGAVAEDHEEDLLMEVDTQADSSTLPVRSSGRAGSFSS